MCMLLQKQVIHLFAMQSLNNNGNQHIKVYYGSQWFGFILTLNPGTDISRPKSVIGHCTLHNEIWNCIHCRARI